MEARCVDIERMGEVVDLPADHPLRQHVDACPRCRNVLRAYQKFVDAEPVEGYSIEAARRKLDALIDTKVGERRPSVSRQSSEGFSGLLRAFMRPAPLVAAAAVAIVIAALVWQQSRESDGILLRDESASSSSALPSAEIRPDGSIRLTWAAVPGADAYQIRIYGPSFTEIYRHPNVLEPSAVIARSSLPADLPPQLDLMWRVFALQAGDVIGTSEPGSIRTR